MFFSRLVLAAFCAVPLAPATAHEFWIEPLSYQIEPGDRLQADFRNGENFEGGTLSFFDRSSTRYELSFDGTVTEIAPRSGDSPALDIPGPAQDGLAIVVHETAPSTLTYKKWEKFLKFAAHKDFPEAAADHAAAGWSMERFKESYTRHAKTLVAVGDGAGRDTALGLATEFVAQTNPYAADFDNAMTVTLLYQGAPRRDAQVEVFDRAPDGAVTVSLYRTNDTGQATIPVTPGHSYLFDAVVLRPFEGEDPAPDAPVWETLWAALTFAVPQ